MWRPAGGCSRRQIPVGPIHSARRHVTRKPTENPRHLYLLHAYNRHRYLEMAGRYREIFAPEMTVEHPVYHFNMLGRSFTLDGAEQVQAVYHAWSETAQCAFYAEGEKLAVSDDMIVSSSVIYQQTPGTILASEGVPVDPDVTYLVKTAEHMIWPYDDQGRLVGEDVWEYTTRPFASSSRSSPPRCSPSNSPRSCSIR